MDAFAYLADIAVAAHHLQPKVIRSAMFPHAAIFVNTIQCAIVLSCSPLDGGGDFGDAATTVIHAATGRPSVYSKAHSLFPSH